MRIFNFLMPVTEKPAPAPAVRRESAGASRETAQDRTERQYADAVEILRRMYARVPCSRRAMQEQGMGGRRWAQAFLMLQKAGVIDADGKACMEDDLLARRVLWACREHYIYEARQGRYTSPI